MDVLRANTDQHFFMQQPYGVLMGAQMILSLVILILFFFAPFLYEGTSLAILVSSVLLLYSIVQNVLHVFGIQRRAVNLLGRQLYFPPAFVVFVFAAFGAVGMAISSLIVFIGFIDSLRFKVTLIIVYALLSLSCAALTAVCTRILMLMFRAAPNGKVLGLMGVVLEGDRAIRVNGPGGPSQAAQQFPVNPV
ncbi:unnamed protein product [Caenorhabditis auriculariae]|uniref:Uncharacterized protein n=1 Tax=Caenorhabditis auriculariae TaxID=2777116 RepID=A0A8S1HAM4_9PELO|nr:unnamed protein product [Caenorhabditis auriculariae]